jgi:hypothetical protein
MIFFNALSRSVEQQGDGVDGDAGQRADDSAVDADELQVAPGEQLHLTSGLGAVPPVDDVPDQRRELRAVLLDRPHDRALEHRLEPLLQLGVLGHPLGEPHERGREPRGQRSVGIAELRAHR